MPLYEYRCPQCGLFDHRRDADQASTPLNCPSCSAPAGRVYTPPGIHRRTGPLAGASAADRARVDKALAGEPTLTTQVGGRPLPAHNHRH